MHSMSRTKYAYKWQWYFGAVEIIWHNIKYTLLHFKYYRLFDLLFFAHCLAFLFFFLSSSSLFLVFVWRSVQRITFYSISMSMTTIVDAMPLVLGPQGPQGKYILLEMFCAAAFCSCRLPQGLISI